MLRKMWIARDKSGSLWLFTTKPFKYKSNNYKSIGFWTTNREEYIQLPKSMYPEIKWEDKQPTKVLIDFKKIFNSEHPKKKSKKKQTWASKEPCY